MLALTQRKGAAPGPIEAAPHQITTQPALVEPRQGNGDGHRLQALSLQFARHGLSVATTDSGQVLLTGPGLCLLADPRAAWLYLRALNRGQA